MVGLTLSRLADLAYHSGRTVTESQHNLLKRSAAAADPPKAENTSEKPDTAEKPAEKAAETPASAAEPEPELKTADQVGSGPFALTKATKFLLIKYHGEFGDWKLRPSCVKGRENELKEKCGKMGEVLKYKILTF